MKTCCQARVFRFAASGGLRMTANTQKTRPRQIPRRSTSRDDDKKQILRCAQDDKSSLRFDLSIVTPTRWTIRILARVRLLGLFGKEAALFAASNAAVCPKSLENHFGGCRNLRVIFF